MKPNASSRFSSTPSLVPAPLTPEQIATYTSVGGTPHLDGDYTVFGEVVQGLEVVDKIAAVQCGQGDRPVQDVHMWMRVVK